MSSREHTAKVYGDGALKVHVALFWKKALQVQIKRRRIEQETEKHGNKKAMYVVPAHFCACACINNSRCTKEDKLYS